MLYSLLLVSLISLTACSSQPRTGFNANDPSEADLVLRTLPPTVNRVAVVPAGPEDERVTGMSPCHLTGGADGSCLSAKRQCDDDADCLNRLIYLHQTCTPSSTCQTQCKTAVLNLHQLALGRLLLATDLSCLANVRPELAKCQLLPTSRPLHCTFAQSLCEQQAECALMKTEWMNECETRVQVGLPTVCSRVERHVRGRVSAAVRHVHGTRLGLGTPRLHLLDSRRALRPPRRLQSARMQCRRAA